MIQLTEKQLIELLHKAIGNVKDFVMDNKGWVNDNLPQNAVKKNDGVYSKSDMKDIANYTMWNSESYKGKTKEDIFEDFEYCMRQI